MSEGLVSGSGALDLDSCGYQGLLWEGDIVVLRYTLGHHFLNLVPVIMAHYGPRTEWMSFRLSRR